MSVLTLAEVMAHLNITSDENADELQDVIDAAEAAVGTRVGPLEPETRTRRVTGSRAVLLLPSAPVASVTSVTDKDGNVLTVGDLTLDGEAGTVEYTDGTRFTVATYDVVYEAGWSPPPDDLLFATKELIRHLWSTQRGGATRPGSSPQESQPGAGWAFPNRVSELLEPYRSPRVA